MLQLENVFVTLLNDCYSQMPFFNLLQLCFGVRPLRPRCVFVFWLALGAMVNHDPLKNHGKENSDNFRGILLFLFVFPTFKC